MKRRMNRKIVVSVITVLVFSFILGAVVFADGAYRDLKAWFGNLSIFRNNEYVELSSKPFIIDGTTYVPLRAVSELFDKDVIWDGVNYRIDLNDKPDENLINVKQQLYNEQMNVMRLEAKVKQLEEELADKKGSLDDLESYLNKQYGTYKKIEFDINLYESKKDIEVDIYVDLDYDYREWDNLSTSSKKNYLQNIVNDILDDYKNVNIEGSIMDSSRSGKNTLVSFYTKSNGTVVMDTDYSWDYDRRYNDLYDLEDDLNYNYDRYEGVSFDIELYEDSYGDIEVTIFVDEDDWDDLGWREQERYLEKIYKKIIREYPRVDVYGYIYDYYYNYRIDSFEFDSDGYINFY
ncbi:MAG: stalk domain-containing protein [Candidatus Alkaliphilus sp. MAG34]